ncbi:hypothetical protein ACIPLR_26500 [Herbaspirillum huttiense]|uniref:hypothetical protein n=1 Tax=Herbaspirillum TaxID=963 RepID=UPI00067B721B|nr:MULTISPECIES: hypothetical protein [Herbaspirillum]MCP3656837.1 hypothetical protein [Herbaspirillum sp.]MCP3950559.1 hypothetical protein [Herbaspirillum sp.]MCP4031094.1 hypothetical protein [Herbaspirillum sp.]MRT30953.1 hypothetical protein [Herbaspirillum sp. CAH-3]ONN67825.1 hypothetical protein BTM36_04270 [Herbaspirillum sp. VT-16-41]
MIRSMQQLMFCAGENAMIIFVGMLIHQGNKFPIQGVIQIMMKPLRAQVRNANVRNKNREH